MISVQRVMGLSIALGSAACAPQPVSSVPRPMAPQDGPRASIRTTISGGFLSRSVDASFTVDENAYVLVGHLGGDGVVRVLYPKSPSQRGFVGGKKTYRTGFVDGRYDAAPSFFASVSPYRSSLARMDSYDGRGNGFIFIIASKSPLFYDEVSDGGDWDALSVDDYRTAYDPRYVVRDFAELLSGGYPFTLKFANAFNTIALGAFTNSFECAVLASTGFLGYSSFWNNNWSSPWQLGSGSSQCGSRGLRYAWYGTARRYASIPMTSVPTTPTTPATPTTPTVGRPTGRPRTLPGRNSALDRSPFTPWSDAGRSHTPRDHGSRTSSPGWSDRVSRPADAPRVSPPQQTATPTAPPAHTPARTKQ